MQLELAVRVSEERMGWAVWASPRKADPAVRIELTFGSLSAADRLRLVVQSMELAVVDRLTA